MSAVDTSRMAPAVAPCPVAGSVKSTGAQLVAAFPPRPVAASWPATEARRSAVLDGCWRRRSRWTTRTANATGDWGCWRSELGLHRSIPVGGAVEAAHLPQGRVGDDGPEPVGVAGHPVRHVAAEGAAHRRGPRCVDLGPRDHVVHDRHQVREGLLAPATPATTHEVEAVAGGQPRVRQHHGISPLASSAGSSASATRSRSSAARRGTQSTTGTGCAGEASRGAVSHDPDACAVREGGADALRLPR